MYIKKTATALVQCLLNFSTVVTLLVSHINMSVSHDLHSSISPLTVHSYISW